MIWLFCSPDGSGPGIGHTSPFADKHYFPSQKYSDYRFRLLKHVPNVAHVSACRRSVMEKVCVQQMFENTLSKFSFCNKFFRNYNHKTFEYNGTRPQTPSSALQLLSSAWAVTAATKRWRRLILLFIRLDFLKLCLNNVRVVFACRHVVCYVRSNYAQIYMLQ